MDIFSTLIATLLTMTFGHSAIANDQSFADLWRVSQTYLVCTSSENKTEEDKKSTEEEEPDCD